MLDYNYNTIEDLEHCPLCQNHLSRVSLREKCGISSLSGSSYNVKRTMAQQQAIMTNLKYWGGMLAIYNFHNENLSDYEKTMLRLASSFGAAGLCDLEESDIIELSNLLKLDYRILEKALHTSEEDDVDDYCGMESGNTICDEKFLSDHELFIVIFDFNYIFKCLSQISDKNDITHVRSNMELFESILFNFNVINSTTSTYECMYNNCFSLNYIINYNSDFHPKDSINSLKLFLLDNDYYEKNKDILPIIYQLLWYEFYTRTNTMYLITIAQIIKHSPFFNKSICEIAGEFYSHLLFMLKNARVISIQINSLFCTELSEPGTRTKEDNTTRLQVLYGYNNYDAYAIRLDLVHEGQGFVHYNNISPGGIRCCLFNKLEYTDIITKYPQLTECFIEYGDRWALKERNNCNMTKVKAKLYDSVRKAKSHDPAFQKNYSEENIKYFIELLGNMLPQSCYVPIDREEAFAKSCFNYDKIMSEVSALYLAYLASSQKNIEKIIKNIVNRAAYYNLISEMDKKAYSCLDGICIIVECSKKKILVA